MKKVSQLVLFFALFISVFGITEQKEPVFARPCNPDIEPCLVDGGDDTPVSQNPYIVVNTADITIREGQSFTVPSCSANDPQEGSVDCIVTNSVNKHRSGIYYIYYDAVDSQGNEASTRKVKVIVTEFRVDVEIGRWNEYSSVSQYSGTYQTVTVDEIHKYYDVNEIGGFMYGCPSGWTKIDQYSYEYICKCNVRGLYNTRYEITNRSASITENWSQMSSSRKTYLYDYESWDAWVVSAPTVDIMVVDGDAMVIYDENGSFVHAMTRNTHFNRNDNQINFPSTLTEFWNRSNSSLDTYWDPFLNTLISERETYTHYDGQVYKCDALSTDPTYLVDKGYYHRIAVNDNNIDEMKNLKFSCKITGETESHEVVYNFITKQKVTAEEVLGTYNFADGSVDGGTPHYYEDVYPYLIWGNAAKDNTTIYERFIYDYFAGAVQHTVSNRYGALELRGEDLYEHYAIMQIPLLDRDEYVDNTTEAQRVQDGLDAFDFLDDIENAINQRD